ncbi:hypothetical protein [Lacipirellula parvula]|uniref:Uncharacterized protein n=1 Tax=Lacipirellula parvula TaxID=2650471 RepID=A0A5K7XH21_9BACT|nr:hypothetical protein [Lacipirellula parvula]BBO36170.1 hypothetical protein PLANPX_5782 [Lacipirellula parvula]
MLSVVARPAMWTYLILAAIASLAVAKPELPPVGFQATVMAGFLFGQLWLVAIWAAVGRAPRLIRAMGLLLGMLVGSAIVCRLDGEQSMERFREGLGPMLLVVSPVFVPALLTKIVLDWKKVGSTEQMRFPLKELLGWMTVVAAASWLLNAGDFGLLEHSPPTFRLLLAAGVAAGVAGAVCHRDAIPLSFKVASVALALVAVGCCLKIGSIKPPNNFLWGAVGGGLYLVIAFILRGYDDRSFSRRLEASRRVQQSLALSEHD